VLNSLHTEGGWSEMTKPTGASLKFAMHANDKIIVNIYKKIKSLNVKENVVTECPQLKKKGLNLSLPN
jgi:hypothetical protein